METHYERLSFLDSTFLAMEGPTNPMHVGATMLFDPGEASDVGTDIGSLRDFIAARLQYVPRYRQRLRWIPVERHPVWVDDEHFDLAYHVRHAALPHPGTPQQLEELAGRILSQRLDRHKPMWEVWVVEGLEDGRFAVITKVHHCMIDGIGGVDLLKVLLAPMPTDDQVEPDVFEPRPSPTSVELFRDEFARRARIPFEAARSARRFVEESKQLGDEVRLRIRAMTNSARSGWFRNASETPLNQRIGPNRRIAWLETDLAAVKSVKNSLGGTVNDVVIAAVAGGIRRFLIEDRKVDVEGLDFRAMVPVSIRGEIPTGDLGNQVTMWLVDLPVGVSDPVQRLQAVTETTLHLKVTDQALGAAMLTQGASFTPGTILSVAARVAAATARPFNLTITNVPGPQLPLYLLGSRLTEIYPMVPLWVNHGLGVALFSYDGKLNWGFVSDWDLVPDLDVIVQRVAEELKALFDLAKPKRKTPSRKTSSRKTTAKKPAAKKAPAKKPAAKTATKSD